MIISAIVKNNEIKGDHILIISKDECHILLEAVIDYSDRNKRKQKVKKMAKELEASLQIW